MIVLQQPFFKYTGKKRDKLILDLKNIIMACKNISIKYIVFPLVDNGSVKNSSEEKSLLEGLKMIEKTLIEKSIKIIFESDYNPNMLRLLSQVVESILCINYDTGNSASLGFDADEEINAYGYRILNVHIKDRLFDGETVPLGKGNANIPKVIKTLNLHGYKGNYILQTARAKKDHVGALSKYQQKLIQWLKEESPDATRP